MPGKRQHYVPRFMLRRFSIDPADRKSLVYRLDKKTGKNGRVNSVNEAVVSHYYRIVGEDGTVDNTADELLDRLETKAAPVIAKLDDPTYRVTADDVLELMLFVVTLKQRTPQGREALSETDVRAGEMWLEVMLSDRARYHRVVGEGRPPDEVEAERLRYLQDLREGRLELESSASREVALMFLAVEQSTQTIFEQLGCVCVRPPTETKSVFVLSDHPVAHYDPTPKMPEAGRGFMSSPTSVTFIPLDPKFGLLLTQDAPGTWRNVALTVEDVNELNLLTYAWAREAIYGPTQDSVTRVRRMAKTNRHLLGELAYRPPRVWVAKVDAATAGAGLHTFTSRFKGQQVTRTLHVTQEGIDHARRNAWPQRAAEAPGEAA